jgi:DnaJ like chaperone protein
MAWWGKLFGGAFGYLLGGPLGAVLGAALGHHFDKGLDGLPDDQGAFREGDKERVQMAFFTATFSVMGCVAKADGRVSEEECHRRYTLMQMFVEIQLQAAYADGVLKPSEERILLHICELLGFSENDFRQIERRVQAERHFGQGDGRQERGRQAVPPSGPTLADAYDVLGVSDRTSDTDVKKAYRRLMNQHHPDKLVSKGLPEEMMKMAEQKTKEIKQAYEKVKQVRGLR